MIDKTGLFPAVASQPRALASESPRNDDAPGGSDGKAFGRLLDTHLQEPAADAAAGARMGVHKGDAGEEPTLVPTAAELQRALEGRPTLEAVETDDAGAAQEDARTPESPSEDVETPPEHDSAPGDPLLAAPQPVPTGAAAPAPLPALLAPPATEPAVAVAPVASADGDAKTATTSGDPTPSPTRTQSPDGHAIRGAGSAASAARGPGRTEIGESNGAVRGKVAERPARAASAAKPKVVAENAAPAVAAAPPAPHFIAPRPAEAAATDVAHTAGEPSPGARGERDAAGPRMMQSTPIPMVSGEHRSSEAAEGVPAAPELAEDAADAGVLLATPGVLAAEPVETTVVPRGLASPSAPTLPATKASSTPVAAPASTGVTVDASTNHASRGAAEAARPATRAAMSSALPAEAPSAGAAGGATRAAGSGNADPGDGRGPEGRERPAAPERVVTAERRAPSPTHDKARPDADATAERPLRAAAEAREPARAATPSEALPSPAPVVAGPRASSATAVASPAPASLRHEAVAPSVNVVTLAAATRSEVDIPELGRIVIAAERRRNRVDLEIHAAEPATVQLLQEKAPEMLHEVNQVAQVAAVNVHQSKAGEGARPGEGTSARGAGDSSPGAGGQGTRQERHSPERERAEMEIPGPIATSGGRVRFVL